MIKLDQDKFLEMPKTDLLKDKPVDANTEAELSAMFKDKWLDMSDA